MPIDGVILPNIASFEEARAAVAQTKWPPAGERSLGNERHDAIWQAYAQPDPLVGMLVEHPGAVAEIEKIFSDAADRLRVGRRARPRRVDGHRPALRRLRRGRAAVPQRARRGDRPRARRRARQRRALLVAEPGADATIVGVDARIVQRAATEALERARSAFASPAGPA